MKTRTGILEKTVYFCDGYIYLALKSFNKQACWGEMSFRADAVQWGVREGGGAGGGGIWLVKELQNPTKAKLEQMFVKQKGQLVIWWKEFN